MKDPSLHEPEAIFLASPSALSSWNRDSSLHVTHVSTLQSLYSLAQARRASDDKHLMNGTLVGRRLPKPHTVKQALHSPFTDCASCTVIQQGG
ncbi:hypothetical protein TNCV_994631 [Trichonephila clavipes]|nr:hypothetical protein TNCV_994631 [Trichonephila clavipes]